MATWALLLTIYVAGWSFVAGYMTASSNDWWELLCDFVIALLWPVFLLAIIIVGVLIVSSEVIGKAVLKVMRHEK